MVEEIQEMMADLRKRAETLRGRLDIDGLGRKLVEIEKEAGKATLWDDPERAKLVLREKNRLESIVKTWSGIDGELKDLDVLFELAREAQDEATFGEVRAGLERLEAAVRGEEVRRMLGRDEDRLNAILTIHAGAGGTEAQDWAEILLRMYLRWAEKRAFRTQILDFQPGEEAGLKSATVEIEGDYAFGYTKAESGIHRLVRISPFDAAARRHTSFASVFVYPEVGDEIVIDIDEKDLKVDTYRSSGKGGQHVNKTDSAVRITHLPTGIVVQCQNERSQHKNRAMALKVLRSRLYEIKLEEQSARMEELHKSKKEIAWGSQIRSYVLHPYKLIKDHRTNLETGNVQKILDGDLDEFIEAYLIAVAQPSS
ncbi:MAG: peptide chain release factor 2 [Pseudomonadota bacterium]|nr:peptide chain release factor 2 [Syntrophobacterales bacterium]MDI9555074.1 peptide chain release factor 2 [Pseudomonadota bacterium]HNU85242.1 peptide chain release factor 2 [Syntrophales bacterium]HNZ34524.1 peptide chain release factor 2 [Syntrophales bacterium]HOF73316.1 peptide chain release factor 2 [Syntrophales bacterium]